MTREGRTDVGDARADDDATRGDAEDVAVSTVVEGGGEGNGQSLFGWIGLGVGVGVGCKLTCITGLAVSKDRLDRCTLLLGGSKSSVSVDGTRVTLSVCSKVIGSAVEIGDVIATGGCSNS